MPLCGMANEAATTTHTHRCSHCAALYDVLCVDKRWLGHGDERVICDCGWPLKEWVSFKAHIFTRRADMSAGTHLRG